MRQTGGREMMTTLLHTLRPATAAEYAFLYQRYVATLQPFVAQGWGWDEPTQAERLRQRFDLNRLRIVVAQGQEIGLLEVQERPSHRSLATLRILPAVRRQGWGTHIVRDLLQQAHDAGAPVRLQVLTVNHAARRLDARLALRVSEEPPTHYHMSAQGGELPSASG